MPRSPWLAASLLGLVACAPPSDDTTTWPGAEADIAWDEDDVSTPVDLAAPPAPLVLTAPQLLTVGGTTTIVLTGVRPSSRVTVYGSIADPSGPPACPPVLVGGCLGLAAPARVVLTSTAGRSGTLSIPIAVPSPFGPALGAMQVVETRNGFTRVSNVDTMLLDTAGTDYDSDGLSNADEVAAGTDVRDPDTDGDGTQDGADECALDPAKADAGACGCGEPEVDVDGDGVCGADLCVGDDAAGDPDGDGLCSDLDACPLDAPKDDDDGDGVCDADDLCEGYDVLGDSDGDGVCGSDLGKVVLIPAGNFTMGCVAGRDDIAIGCFEQTVPAHTVVLTRTFWMMEAEVTQFQYAAVMGSNPSYFSGSTLPVEQVSWNDAVLFADLVSASNGLTPCGSGNPYACDGWRLPTEAEWEYAARGGEDFEYAGSSIVGDVSWYANNSGSTHDVCTKARNGFGLCDMSGNVWEWTSDRYGVYPSTSSVDPTGPASGSSRARRGGSYFHDAVYSQVAYRSSGDSGLRYSNLGFRLVRSVP